MTIKEVKPIRFLFFRTETTINELNQFMWVAKALMKEAVHYDLTVTGPVHWHYHGFMGDFNKSFVLEICLPVADVLPEYDGEFHFKVTEPFKCISIMHEGNWLEIPSSYAKLLPYMQAQNLIPIGVNREIYTNVDFIYPDANSTELQLGVKAVD